MSARKLTEDIEAFAARMRQSRLMLQAQQGRVSRKTVERYLRAIHYLVRHTPVHLELARKRAEFLCETELAGYFERKAGEESGHDRWAEADLVALGASLDGGAVSVSSVVALEKYLRKIIEEDPGRYLAYILFAEYFTVLMGSEWVQTLEQRCGVPPRSMSVIERHVDLDKGHVVDGIREIETLISDPERLERLHETLEQSMRYFAAFCDELAA